MKKLTNYLLPTQTKDLYAKESVSSISLAHDVADKINEIVDYLNEHDDLTAEKILEQDGKIRKGIIYMKDNLANTIYELLELMKSNGEVDNIIYQLLSDKVNEIKPTQKRLFRALLGNNVYIPNTEYKYDNYNKYLNQALKTKFDDIILVFHIENLKQVSEDISLMRRFRDELIKNNINCDTIKIHCTSLGDVVSIDDYKTTINYILNEFIGIKNIWIFNEIYEFVKNNIDSATELVNYFKDLGYRVGSPLSGSEWNVRFLNNSFVNSLDMIGLNWYPMISADWTKPAPEFMYDDAINYVINNFISSNKDIYLTEYGIPPYYDNLPSSGKTGFTRVFKDDEVQRLFYGAILKSKCKELFKGVYFWFYDYATDETCNHINSYIRGEKND